MTSAQTKAYQDLKNRVPLALVAPFAAGALTYFPTGSQNDNADDGVTLTGTDSIFDDGVGAFNGRRAIIHRLIASTSTTLFVEIEDHLGTGHVYRVDMHGGFRGRSLELNIPVSAGFRMVTEAGGTATETFMLVYSVEGLGGF